MKPLGSLAVLALSSELLIAAPAEAQKRPAAPGAAAVPQRDWRTFVKLRCDCIVESYELVRQGNQLSLGRKVKSERAVLTVGSGTVVSADGLILTNLHVLEAMFEPWDPQPVSETHADRVVPTGRIVVAMLDQNDPRRPPANRFLAEPIAAHSQGMPDRDIALLKITRDYGTSLPVVRSDFASLRFGNPFALPLEAEVTVIGYPGTGGENVTPTRGLFLGFAEGGGLPKGALKTSAGIDQGNSGGAMLHGEALVGIPTWVTRQAGQAIGYAVPVTWAAEPLARAHLRGGYRIPEIPRAWVESEFNQDGSRYMNFLGGTVVAAQTRQPVEGAQVILYRPDRSLEQIVSLHQEIRSIMFVFQVQQALADGSEAQAIAEALQTSVEEVNKAAAVDLAAVRVSADARAMLQGEFFYGWDRTGPDGGYFIAAPRGRQLRMVVGADGFRQASAMVPTGDKLVRRLPETLLYRIGP